MEDNLEIIFVYFERKVKKVDYINLPQAASILHGISSLGGPLQG